MFYLHSHSCLMLWIEATKVNSGTIFFTNYTDILLNLTSRMQLTRRGHYAFLNWYNGGFRYWDYKTGELQ